MIEGLVAIGLIIGVVVASVAAGASTERRRRAAWAKAAAKLGLKLAPNKLAMRGTIGEIEVHVEYDVGTKAAPTTRFSVLGPRDLGFALHLHMKDLILRSAPGMPVDRGKLDEKFCVVGR